MFLYLVHAAAVLVLVLHAAERDLQLHLSPGLSHLPHKWTGCHVSTGGREELPWPPLLSSGFSILSKFPTNLPFLLLVLVKVLVLGQSESKLYGGNREMCTKTAIKACIIFSTRAVLIPVVLFVCGNWGCTGGRPGGSCPWVSPV